MCGYSAHRMKGPHDPHLFTQRVGVWGLAWGPVNAHSARLNVRTWKPSSPQPRTGGHARLGTGGNDAPQFAQRGPASARIIPWEMHRASISPRTQDAFTGTLGSCSTGTSDLCHGGPSVFIPTYHYTCGFHQLVPSSLTEDVFISKISWCSDWLEWKPAYSRPSVAHDWTPLM